MKCWAVVCLFAGAAGCAVAADVSLSELAPPGTDVVVGVNVRGLLNSPLAAEIGAPEHELAAQMTASRNLIGFDPFKDLDQAWLLMAGTDAKAPALVVVRGRFDVEQLGRGARRYKDIPVLGDAKGGEAVIGFINGEMAVIGEPVQVEAAIDRIGSAPHLDAELKDRIEVAASRYEVWGIGELPEGVKVAAGGGSPSSIDRFMFGLALRQGLGVTAEVHAHSTEDAAKMTAVLSMLDAALKSQKSVAGVTLDVQSENGTFRIGLTVPETVLRQTIKEQRASLVASLSKRAGGAPAKSAEAKALPPPILIEPKPATVAAPEIPPAPPAQPLPAPKPAPKPSTQPEIQKAPDGDTVFVKLPGGR